MTRLLSKVKEFMLTHPYLGYYLAFLITADFFLSLVHAFE